ncbi:DUF3592 domain-containing protein [Nonomuraea zeae]|uniref:DUF3592 domain-containing protein n=1 Tax=Nonomuraea zeae TaxID=1642303 RepID=UPI001478FB55|nr:DUF3592 domain-containing protein [Nonomuraea zeae]
MERLIEYSPLLFVAFGLLIILVSGKGMIDGRRFVQRALRVPGVVSDVRTTFTGRGEHLRARQRPVLTFTTLDGREVTTEASTVSNLGVGNATEVLYDPDDPTRAMPASGGAGGYGGVVAGIIAIVIGLAFFAGVSSLSAPSTSGDPAGCEIELPDGSSETIDCPPGLGSGE